MKKEWRVGINCPYCGVKLSSDKVLYADNTIIRYKYCFNDKCEAHLKRKKKARYSEKTKEIRSFDNRI